MLVAGLGELGAEAGGGVAEVDAEAVVPPSLENTYASAATLAPAV